MKTSRSIFKHLAIVMASLAVGFTLSIVVAIATSSFWGWFEKTTGIESLGHSGPADWVYIFLFVVFSSALIAGLELSLRRR